MSLADALPVIDNRTFDDIVAEAQTRIPNYTPEWTDFNPGDAGFALVELFAWMTELLIYRLNQVPELNYIKFLELIGIELEPAQPATAVLCFPVQANFALPTVAVPSGTQVAADPNDGGPPVVFQATASITALAMQLNSVQTFDGYAYTDLTADNAQIGTGFQPFGPLAAAGSALLLGFGPSSTSGALQPIPPGTNISLVFWPNSSGASPAPTACASATAVYPSATVTWQYWNGVSWQPLKVAKDETLALTRYGFVILKSPATGQLAADELGFATDMPRFWLRAYLTQSSYETPPSLLAIRANAVTATATQNVNGEVLGGSDGSANQTFTLTSTPVIDGSLVLQIDEGEGFVTWTEVEDFFGYGPNDQVYVLDPTSGVVTFGDGTNGQIPVANVSSAQTNIVAQTYQFGGGARSNVSAGMISTLMTSIPGIDSSNVSNPVAADGGTDEETVDAAKLRAPEVLNSQDRAVTCGDFELLARQAGPVARAKALPLFNPNFPGVEVPGSVTVIIVPNAASPTPRPSPGLLQTVCAYLDQRRLITTELYVMAPTYVPVAVAVAVLAATGADIAQVQQDVETAITTFLDPLVGGSDGQGWPFGGTIYYSDLFRTALVSDVQRVESLSITLNGTTAAPCADVPIPTGNLLTVSDVNVTVDSNSGAS